MALSFFINRLTFSDGTSLELKRDSVVVFVGPNNSGKSKVLKEILNTNLNPNSVNVILKDLEVTSSGTDEEIKKYLISYVKGENYLLPGTDNTPGMSSETMIKQWGKMVVEPQNSAGIFTHYLAKFLDTASRLNMVNPVQNIDVFRENLKNPIQELKASVSKELSFSEYFKQAFGQEVIVNQAAGASIPLYVGKRPVSTAKNDRVSAPYQKVLGEQSLLHEQGDGMKSFAGVFLSLFTQDYPLNFVDEPEAFLHPPQAFLLGQMIVTKLEQKKQMFIATHSEDFLKGLFDSAVGRLIIVRLDRDGAKTRINILENESVRKIWKDSLLRYSNVLDGLFHKRVVLVESDSDCLFYSAVTTAIVGKENYPSPDILFVQSGGKHRFPVVISALKALEVPLTIIGDFDFYHDENPLRKVYHELGGDWNDIKEDFKKVKKAIDERLPELMTDDLKAEISKILGGIQDRVVPEQAIKEVQVALKKASPWKVAKSTGKAYLPSGEITQAFERVQTKLALKGMYVLEVGELEAFDKTEGTHGPKWVNKILDKGIDEEYVLINAKEFVKKNLFADLKSSK